MIGNLIFEMNFPSPPPPPTTTTKLPRKIVVEELESRMTLYNGYLVLFYVHIMNNFQPYMLFLIIIGLIL